MVHMWDSRVIERVEGVMDGLERVGCFLSCIVS